jgi:hypothetical protein
MGVKRVLPTVDQLGPNRLGEAAQLAPVPDNQNMGTRLALVLIAASTWPEKGGAQRENFQSYSQTY